MAGRHSHGDLVLVQVRVLSTAPMARDKGVIPGPILRDDMRGAEIDRDVRQFLARLTEKNLLE